MLLARTACEYVPVEKIALRHLPLYLVHFFCAPTKHQVQAEENIACETNISTYRIPVDKGVIAKRANNIHTINNNINLINHILPHQANKENGQGHKVWKPAPKAPGKVADVLKPSDADAVGQCIHARRDRYGEVFVQFHAV